jgi:hypothetical protein
VMFFGGGVVTTPLPALPNCGILELFAGRGLHVVNLDNGTFRMRTADNPWGPWSPAQPLIAEGDPGRAERSVRAGRYAAPPGRQGSELRAHRPGAGTSRG